MAHNHMTHKSSLFLLELILAILFFSIASAVCVQLFVKSHLLSTQAEILSIAVNECSDAAEIILSADTKDEVLGRLSTAYPYAEKSDNQIHIPYDDTHTMMISFTFTNPSENRGSVQTNILFRNIETTELIYELEIKHQIQDSLLLEADYE